jgi:hypothetical protein
MLSTQTLEPSIRMKQDLSIPVNPPVELVVRLYRIVNTTLMRHHKRRLSPAADNEVAQVSIVRFDIALSCAQAQPLLKQLAKADQELSFPSLLIGRSGVSRHVQTRDPQPASRARDVDELVENHVRDFFVAVPAHGLVAYGIDRAIYHAAIGFDDLVDWVAISEVDGYAADFLGGVEAFFHLVNDEDFTRAAKDAGVCCHKPDWTGAEDCDALTSLKAREDEAVPS